MIHPHRRYRRTELGYHFRQAPLEDFPEEKRGEMKGTQAQHALPADKMEQQDQQAGNLPQPGGDGGAGDPQFQGEDEQPVQKDVGDRPGDHGDAHQARGAVVADKALQQNTADKGQGESAVVEDIGGRQLQKGAVGPADSRHRTGEDHACQHEQHAYGDGNGGGVEESIVGALLVAAAKPDGGDRDASYAHQHG